MLVFLAILEIMVLAFVVPLPNNTIAQTWWRQVIHGVEVSSGSPYFRLIYNQNVNQVQTDGTFKEPALEPFYMQRPNSAEPASMLPFITFRLLYRYAIGLQFYNGWWGQPR